MKAILIDPTRREVRGVEVDPTKIHEAFGGAKKTLILQKMIGLGHVLYYDFYAAASGRHPFWYAGHDIVGKGLVFDRVGGVWPVSTTLTVREVECNVRFSSAE